MCKEFAIEKLEQFDICMIKSSIYGIFNLAICCKCSVAPKLYFTNVEYFIRKTYVFIVEIMVNANFQLKNLSGLTFAKKLQLKNLSNFTYA